LWIIAGAAEKGKHGAFGQARTLSVTACMLALARKSAYPRARARRSMPCRYDRLSLWWPAVLCSTCCSRPVMRMLLLLNPGKAFTTFPCARTAAIVTRLTIAVKPPTEVPLLMQWRDIDGESAAEQAHPLGARLPMTT
jgi:hypothetical protein